VAHKGTITTPVDTPPVQRRTISATDAGTLGIGRETARSRIRERLRRAKSGATDAAALVTWRDFVRVRIREEGINLVAEAVSLVAEAVSLAAEAAAMNAVFAVDSVTTLARVRKTAAVLPAAEVDVVDVVDVVVVVALNAANAEPLVQKTYATAAAKPVTGREIAQKRILVQKANVCQDSRELGTSAETATKKVTLQEIARNRRTRSVVLAAKKVITPETALKKAVRA
jgi:hypothetical protein